MSLPWRRKPQENRYHRWELLVCAIFRHLTFIPTDKGKEADEIRDRLHRVIDGVGEFSRCLRCGTFVPGAPRLNGPLADAPRPARGARLRSIAILRFLALERFGRGFILLGIGLAIIQFRSAQASFQDLFARDFPILHEAAAQLHYDVDSSTIVFWIRGAVFAGHNKLAWIAAGILVYAVLEIAEGLGLWMNKRGGEWLAAVITFAFIPLEIFELVEHTTVLKIGALAVNLFLLAYLVWSKKLWPGGHKIMEARLATESILEVKRAAGEPTDEGSLAGVQR